MVCRMGWMDWATWLWRKETAGAKAERVAAGYLRKAGMRVLARNVQCEKGELDIVAMEGQTLVFVEVRGRGSEEFGTPEMSIGAVKREHVLRAAKWFVRRRRLGGMAVRFDVVAVVDVEGRREVRHHRNAFGE